MRDEWRRMGWRGRFLLRLLLVVLVEFIAAVFTRGHVAAVALLLYMGTSWVFLRLAWVWYVNPKEERKEDNA